MKLKHLLSYLKYYNLEINYNTIEEYFDEDMNDEDMNDENMIVIVAKFLILQLYLLFNFLFKFNIINQ
ncbi:hypothetical protein U3516DRAFT_732790 [Neocallimastix sp. 'constans']